MEYLILIYGNESERGNPTEEEQQAVMAAYFNYNQLLQDAGVYMGGNALHDVKSATSIRVRDGQALMTDGPFAETKEQLGGYYQIKCENLDEALKWGAACPGAAHGTVEVRPILDLG